jgi:hypothetical protein
MRDHPLQLDLERVEPRDARFDRGELRRAMASAASQGWSGLSARLRRLRMASSPKPSSRAWRMKANRSCAVRS